MSSITKEEIVKIHQLGRNLLHRQTQSVDHLIKTLAQTNDDNQDAKLYVPILMIQAVGVSLHSVLALTKERDMAIRDCFGIARSAVETAVNAAFISVSGEPMAEKAVRHMKQKRWRDLRRRGRIGNSQITVSRDISIEIDDVPGLRDALAEYTTKRGEELRDWTPESIEKRISVISERHKKAGFCLGAASFAIYRPASELLHGTFYGVNLFWQGSRSEPARRAEDFDDLWITDHFITLLTALVFAVSGSIMAISSVHNLDHHLNAQEKLISDLGQLLDIFEQENSDEEHHFNLKDV